MMTFNEYLEDVLDLNVGLMSEREIAAAREGYAAFTAPRKAAPKHPDTKMSVGDLRARCERLIAGQARDAEKFTGVAGYEAAVIAARAAVAEGRALLAAKRPTKAAFIAHAAANSAASRTMNAAAK